MEKFIFTLKLFFSRQRKSLLFLSLAFIFTIQTLYTVPVYGFALPAEFRVGLESQYKNVSSLSISNTAINAGYSGGASFRLHSPSGFTAAPAKSYYTATEQYYSSYEAARAAANSRANSVVAYRETNSWSVYLGGYGSEQEAKNAGAIVYPSRPVFLSWGNGEGILFDNPNAFPQVSDADGGTVQLGNRAYRGRVELFRYSGGNLQPVNILSPEQYLYSTVPSEMPSGWHIEALKAQAVAGRSYAVTRMGIHSERGYDLCDTGHCQNYIGASNESAAGIEAVQATTGLMVYYENEPINASYFSSSGGVTADSGDVWPNQLPYLTSVLETNEPEAKVWSRAFTLSEITGLLSANNINIGQAVSVSIGSLSVNGRVNRLIITGTNGSHILEKEDIRNFFIPSSGGILESRNFTISNGSLQTQNTDAQVVMSNGADYFSADVKGLAAVSSDTQTILEPGAVYAQGNGLSARYNTVSTVITSDGNSVVFSGRGWGHGVGMSQFGAKGMAEAGYNFIQILEYYYSGTKVY